MMKKFLMDESGQGMVEYGLILALIAVAAIAVIKLLGPKITGMFSEASTQLNDVPGATAAPAGG